MDNKGNIGLCGDWCYGNNVSSAILSAASLSKAIKNKIN